MTLSVKLDPEAERRLDEVVKQTGKTKAWCVQHAIEEFLEDWEDYHIAIHRLKNEKGDIDISEVIEEFDLED